MKDWNAEVTNAIIMANNKLDEAIYNWKLVVQAEEQLAEQPEGLERDIAQRGVGRAKLVVQVLETLRGRDV